RPGPARRRLSREPRSPPARPPPSWLLRGGRRRRRSFPVSEAGRGTGHWGSGAPADPRGFASKSGQRVGRRRAAAPWERGGLASVSGSAGLCCGRRGYELVPAPRLAEFRRVWTFRQAHGVAPGGVVCRATWTR
ncbi:hypothetical protein Nmel_002708, partial [Mimus melanotis]